MNCWQSFCASFKVSWGAFVASGMLFAALIFLLKTWIKERLAKSIGHEYDVELERFKGAVLGNLEGTKAAYKKALDENQVRFAKLHEVLSPGIMDSVCFR